MKVTALNIALLASGAAAFPAMMDALTAPLTAEGANLRRAIDPAAPQGAGALPASPPPFDAKAQYVSNQGAHAFVPPGPNDARGECPGLNAMANHNYLPHNGIATASQFQQATETVFGMAPDLGGFLGIYGALIDGDGTSWSIGGLPRTGILGSHGNYETDSSPLKSDLNQYGSNTQTIKSQFLNLYNRQPDASTANYNLEVLRDFRAYRYQESIAKNPYFTYNVFAGIEVSQAAFTFIYRFMSNKSAEYPEGVLNKNVLKSFMSYTGPENNLTHTPGYERIPDNWYKRNPSDEYSIPYFQTDILYFAEKYPEILIPGCNQGKVNSYNGISPSTLSNGAYTQADVNKAPVCFTNEYQRSLIATLTGKASSSPLLAPLVKSLNSISSALGCKAITSTNSTAFSACPGFSLYGGPTGPVAPGAIQS